MPVPRVAAQQLKVACLIDLAYILAGDESFPPRLDLLVETYVAKLRTQFESSLWIGSNLIDASMAADAVEAFRTLSSESRLHLFLSPAFYAALMDFAAPSSETFSPLTKLVRDEAAVQERRLFGQAEAEVWSPMGDAAFIPGRHDEPMRFAEKIDDLITIDFESPYARAFSITSPIMSLDFEETSADEQSLVVAKLRGAFAHVENVSPTYARLIRNFTHAIRPRRSTANRGFAAEHITHTTGEIHFLNAQVPEVVPARLSDNLLHESVHNFLSAYEFVEGPFVLLADDKRFRPVSPWTGNPIPIASFCHAVFVWFALFRYAGLEIAQLKEGGAAEADVRSRLNRAAAGFVIPNRLSDSLRGLNHYSGSLLSLFDSLQDSVRADYLRMRSAVAETAAVA